MPTVTNTIVDAAGAPVAGAAVQIELVGSWSASGAQETLAAWSGVTDASGVWSALLPAQSAQEGSTYYVVREPGVTWAFTVADSPSTQRLRDRLTTPVPVATATGLTLDGLADVSAPSPTSGQVLAWNGTLWVPTTGGGGGVSDHGALTGLADDDHGQYHTDARGDARYPPLARLISAGTGLSGGGSLAADRTLAVAYGTTAGTAAQGNDVRLSDARTPTAHAASHHGGSDPVTPAGIGAAAAGHSHSGTYEPAGTVATHEAAADPHPDYLTAAEGNAAYSATGHTHTYAPRIGVTVARVTSGLSGGDAPPDTSGAWVQHTAVGEISRAAAVGDFLTLDLALLVRGFDTTLYDVAIKVGSSLVWFVSSGTGTPSIEGDPALYPQHLVFQGLVTHVPLVVTSDHLDTGSVRFMLAVKSAGSGLTFYGTTYPLRWTLVNHGPPAA